LAKKQENEAVRDFQVSIPPGLVERLGLSPDEEYVVEWLLLRNQTLNLRFLKKDKQQ